MVGTRTRRLRQTVLSFQKKEREPEHKEQEEEEEGEAEGEGDASPLAASKMPAAAAPPPPSAVDGNVFCEFCEVSVNSRNWERHQSSATHKGKKRRKRLLRERETQEDSGDDDDEPAPAVLVASPPFKDSSASNSTRSSPRRNDPSPTILARTPSEGRKKTLVGLEDSLEALLDREDEDPSVLSPSSRSQHNPRIEERPPAEKLPEKRPSKLRDPPLPPPRSEKPEKEPAAVVASPSWKSPRRRDTQRRRDEAQFRALHRLKNGEVSDSSGSEQSDDSAEADVSIFNSSTNVSTLRSTDDDRQRARPSPPRALVNAERKAWTAASDVISELKGNKSGTSGISWAASQKRKIPLGAPPLRSSPSEKRQRTQPALLDRSKSSEPVFVPLVRREHGLTEIAQRRRRGSDEFTSDSDPCSDDPIFNSSDDDVERDREARGKLRLAVKVKQRSPQTYIPPYLPALPVADDVDVQITGQARSPRDTRPRVGVNSALLHPDSRNKRRSTQTTLLSLWRGASARGHSSERGLDDSIFGPVDNLQSSGDEGDKVQASISDFFGNKRSGGSVPLDEDEDGGSVDDFIVDDDDEDAVREYSANEYRTLRKTDHQRVFIEKEVTSSDDEDLLAHDIRQPRNVVDLRNSGDSEEDILADLTQRDDAPRPPKGRLRKGSPEDSRDQSSAEWNLLEEDDPSSSDHDTDDTHSVQQRKVDARRAKRIVTSPLRGKSNIRQRDAFNIYVQFIASCICDPDFFDLMKEAERSASMRSASASQYDSDSDHERDIEAALYFRNGERRIIDAIWQRYELVMHSSAWDSEFQEALQTHGHYRSWPTQNAGATHDCQACRRSNHPAIFEVALGPPAYDALAVWRGARPPSSEEVHVTGDGRDSADLVLYRLGRFCHERTSLYHSLFHYKLHLWQTIERRVRRDLSIATELIPRGKRTENAIGKAHMDVVQNLLADQLFMSSQYRHFGALLETADAFGRKGMSVT